VAGAKEGGVLVSPVGPRAVRLVTHLDVSVEDAKTAAGVLARL
jgi:threonine aldolase